MYDITDRIVMVTKRCGQLSHIFNSNSIGPRLKLRLYIVAVCSLLTYGCESWALTEKVMRKINGANSRMLARVTGNNVRQEARACTTSYDIIKHIRAMRLKWLQQILCGDPNRMVFKAVEMQSHLNTEGSILMDAPYHTNMQELVSLAKDKRQGLLERTHSSIKPKSMRNSRFIYSFVISRHIVYIFIVLSIYTLLCINSI